MSALSTYLSRKKSLEEDITKKEQDIKKAQNQLELVKETFRLFKSALNIMESLEVQTVRIHKLMDRELFKTLMEAEGFDIHYAGGFIFTTLKGVEFEETAWFDKFPLIK